MLKPNTKRTVRTDLVVGGVYGGELFSVFMEPFLGAKVTIERIIDGEAMILEQPKTCKSRWTEAMFEPVPEAKSNYEYIRTFLNDADDVRFVWRFDEQQSDPIHKNFTVDKFKDELKRLLGDVSRKPVPVDDGEEMGKAFEEEWKQFPNKMWVSQNEANHFFKAGAEWQRGRGIK